jgi:hypothetical protein
MPVGTTKASLPIFRQICELIPPRLVSALAREHRIDHRGFSPWSHVVAMLYGHFTRAVGLNDICDGLRLRSSPLRSIRGATPPKRNTLSNANRTRDPGMAQALYWRMLALLQAADPGFARGKARSGYLRRFKATIHAVDSTTIALVANCMDWAKHRRRKAAAKCHMALDLRTMLPRYAVVDTAAEHDSKRAWHVCAGLRAGEIAVFDRAYMDFAHLAALDEREVFWVTRAKEGLKYRKVRDAAGEKAPGILRDEIIVLTGTKTAQSYGRELRRVVALVEVDGREVEMVFLTNNLEWSARSVAELYRARWEIEVFFKQIKQTIQLVDFVGHSKGAVLWQVWLGLLAHLLMRFLAHLSRWGHSFTRLFTLVRAALWDAFPVRAFLERYGTAGGSYRMLARPDPLFFPGFGAPEEYTMGQPKRRRPPKRKAYEKIMQDKAAQPA